MRRAFVSLIFLAALTCGLCFSCPALAGSLRCLSADGNTCWAAGDGGLILRSDDGGGTWQPVPVPAPVAAGNFQSVRAGGGHAYFFGGQAIPGHPAAAGLGAIVHTGDGGRTFQVVPAGPAGWLYGGVFAGQTALTFGQANYSAPGGVQRSIDAGRLWGPAAVSGEGYLLGGDFTSPRDGYLVGGGRRIINLINLAEPSLRPSRIPAPLALRAVRVLDDTTCWCVGDDATVLAFRGAGRPWDVIPVGLPPGARRCADLEAIAFAGPQRVWVAGGLIGVIPFSDSSGERWRPLAAPGPGCLHVLLAPRSDGQVLLAAGDAERIWRSPDGGKTWALVHGRPRTDVLFIVAAGDRSVWPAIVAHAQAGASVAVVFATNWPGAAGTPPSQPLRAAAAAAGADAVAVLTDFPSAAGDPNAAGLAELDILARWSHRLDAPAENQMLAQLAAAVRIYRPLVLAVGPDSDGDGEAPRGVIAENRLVARVARHAAALAADANALPDLAKAGLAPWAVRRTFVGLPANERWAAPWQPLPVIDRQAAVVTFDTARFPGDSKLPLDLLAASAAWRLGGSGLLDRPGQASAYSCQGVDRPLRLFTSGLADARLTLEAGDPNVQAWATCATIRVAMKGDQTLQAATDLIAALARAGTGEQAALIGDRLLLTWWRLLEEGKLIEADTALAAFQRKSSQHPLGQKMDVLTLAMAVSSEVKAQLAAHGVPKKMDLATLERATTAFSAWPAWALTPEGRMLHARALLASGQLPAAQAVIARLSREPYPEDWRLMAMLEAGSAEGADTVLRSRRHAEAVYVTDRGRIDGKLDEECWKKGEWFNLKPWNSPPLSGVSIPPPASGGPISPPVNHGGPTPPRGAGATPAPAAAPPVIRGGPNRFAVAEADPNAPPPPPAVQFVRSAGEFAIFAVRLPRAVGRQWDLTFAIDADRDMWTQIVLRCDTQGHRSAVLALRDGPEATLGPQTFQVQAQKTEKEWTFELAVPLHQFALRPPPVELWAFQLIATAHDMTGERTCYFQPQSDPRLLPERYGLLRIPAVAPVSGRP